MLRMSVPGERSESDKAKPVVKDAGAAVLGSLGIGVTVTDAVKVAGTRAAADPVVLEPAAGDDVLEVTLEGGVRLYLPAEQAPELLAAPPGRAASVPGTVPLASSLAVGDGTRGVGDWVIEGLRLIGVDLAGKTAAAVAAGIDEQQVPRPGLYRWRGHALAPVEERLPEGKEPWLLFLHGTFSNTLGSFGALAAQSAQWRRLEAAYRDRILALDHHTLTRSPIENAEEALARLPEGVELHLVGYSRGGLIGELLCRGQLEGRALPFDAMELGLFDGAGRVEQRAALERLGTSLTALRPAIGRYVRVGCPARGTTLASDRLDRWLNFVLGALGLGVGAVASPIVGEMYDLVTAFLLAVIKERADASTIPGLEAMIPGAPLVRLLNRPGVTAATDLAVLEGDIEGAGILGRLKVLATDLFFREDHDLVVNTSAMDGGMARNPPARASFTQGPEVSHFAYFANPKTAERVVDGLLRADDQDGGFEPIPAEEIGVVTAPAKRGGDKRPVVFVLPGITGTVLSCTDKGRERRIWVDIPQLAFGGLGRLAIDQPAITAKEPLSLYYGEICSFLGGSHDVRPWGYDWRRSILDNAKDFATVLNAALAGTDRPVRIVAHSMGGLVARSAFLDEKLWKPFQERAGSRLIQLGTPNGGSWSIPYMLMGRNSLMSFLAMLDITMSRRAQQEVLVRFPGALQMLPHAEAPLFDAGALGGAGAAGSRRRRVGGPARGRPRRRRAIPRRVRQGAVRSRAPALRRRPCPDDGGHRGGFGGTGGPAHSISRHHGRRWPSPLEHRHPGRHSRLVYRRRAWRPRPPRPSLPGHPRPARDRHHPPAADDTAGCRAWARRAGREGPRHRADVPGCGRSPAGRDGRHPQGARDHTAAQDQDQGRSRPSGVRQASGDGWPLCRRHDQRCGAGAGPGAERPAGQAQGARPLPRRARHQHRGARSPDAAARCHRGRAGRSRRPRARHAVGDLAARAPGLRDRGRRRPVRARAQREGRAAGRHRAAGRRRHRRAADREQHRGAAPGGAGGPARCSAPMVCASWRCWSSWRTGPTAPGTCCTMPCRGPSSRAASISTRRSRSPEAGSATCRATATPAGGSRSRSPWRRSAASG